MIVAILIATGFLLALSAGIAARENWLWPLLNSVCAITPLVPLFLFGGADHIAYLLDDSIDPSERFSDERDNGSSMIGWFMLGASFFTAFSSPILLVQLNVVPMTVVWQSALGSWCFTASLILGGAFVIHFHMPQKSGKEEKGDVE